MLSASFWTHYCTVKPENTILDNSDIFGVPIFRFFTVHQVSNANCEGLNHPACQHRLIRIFFSECSEDVNCKDIDQASLSLRCLRSC